MSRAATFELTIFKEVVLFSQIRLYKSYKPEFNLTFLLLPFSTSFAMSPTGKPDTANHTDGSVPNTIPASPDPTSKSVPPGPTNPQVAGAVGIAGNPSSVADALAAETVTGSAPVPIGSPDGSGANVAVGVAGTISNASGTTAALVPTGANKRKASNPYLVLPAIKKKQSSKKNKGGSNKGNKGKREPVTANVITVKAPEGSDAPSGFFLVFNTDSWVEKQATDSFFDRKVPENSAYRMAIDCVDFVMEELYPDGPGSNVMRNNKGFEVKAIVKTSDELWSDEQIQNWFKLVFLPAFLDREPELSERQVPVFGKITPGKSPYWGYYLKPKCAKRCLNDWLSNTDRLKVKAIDFVKENKGNLYSWWEPGHVPLKIIKDFRLGAQHLDPLDNNKINHDSDVETASMQAYSEEQKAMRLFTAKGAVNDNQSTDKENSPQDIIDVDGSGNEEGGENPELAD